LTLSRDGKELEYKGVFLKREDPGPEDFVLVGAGKTVSSTFDLSSAYRVTQAGTYTVAVDAILEYVEGSVSNLHKPGKPGIQTRIAHLASGYLPRSLKKTLLEEHWVEDAFIELGLGEELDTLTLGRTSKVTPPWHNQGGVDGPLPLLGFWCVTIFRKILTY